MVKVNGNNCFWSAGIRSGARESRAPLFFIINLYILLFYFQLLTCN